MPIVHFKIHVLPSTTTSKETVLDRVRLALRELFSFTSVIDETSHDEGYPNISEFVIRVEGESIFTFSIFDAYLKLNTLCLMITNCIPGRGPLLLLNEKSCFNTSYTTVHSNVECKSVKFGTMPIPACFVFYTKLTNTTANFYHDESKMEIRWKGYAKDYKLTLNYRFIRRIFLNVTEGSVKIYLDLLHAPTLWRVETRRARTMDFMFPSTYYLDHRCRETPSLEAPVIGKANVLLLEIPDLYEGVEILSRFHFRCGKMDVLYGNIEENMELAPNDPHVDFSSFFCDYLMTAILKRNFFVAEQMRMNLSGPKYHFQFTDAVILGKALTKLLFLVDSGRYFKFWDALQSFSHHYGNLKDDDDKCLHYILPDNSRLIRRVIITPTRTLFYAPEVMFENRVLRNFNPDFALRVNFRDDDISRLTYIASYAETNVMEGVKALMVNGIQIADRHYEFLAWSNSQIRDHGVWMYARDSNNHSASDIREWMGDFSHIKFVSKYMARMGQCFSQTVETVSVPLDRNHVRIEKDIEGGYDRFSHKPYCFSDGIGKISSSLAKRVRDSLGRDKYCSAFQIRYGGCKGMLVEDPTLTDADIVFRESMKKFDSPRNIRLEIAKTSAPSPLQLNRPFITLLDQLGVKTPVFLRLQEDMLRQLTDMLLQEDKAAAYLTSKTPLDAFKFHELSAAGMALTAEPFFRSLLLILHRHHVGSIKTRANIAIDPSKGRNMFSVLDETGTLEYGQVFVQYTTDILCGESTPDTTIVTGTVLVTKNPCIYPGDVRKFQAIDVPALRHIKDCIVFPQKGPRPHPNEMAGSDLDGDECAVIWQKDLIFPGENHTPGDFPSHSPSPCSRIDVPAMVDFLIEYIMNDQIGNIATAHLAYADELGISSQKCLDLAAKCSIAVDFAKNGVKVSLSAPEKPKEFPDFMERHYKVTRKSKKALGKMYRICKDFETENMNAAFNYDVEVDPVLVYPGWKKYEKEAISSRDKYNHLLMTIFQNYGVSDESEAFTGAFTRLHCRFQERKDKAEVEKVILGSIRALCKNMRNEFFSGCDKNINNTSTHLYQKASAWYVVTYREKNAQFLSFPWIVSSVLANIYLTQKSPTAVTTQSPLVLRLDARIQETANANLLTLLPDEAIRQFVDYTFLCEAKIVERALRVTMHWAVENKILKDFETTRKRGFLFISTFIKLFLHVASLEGYVVKKELGKKAKTHNKKSSADLCLAFLCFCVSFRFRNKPAMKELVPFEIYKHKRFSEIAMTSYHSLAINGHFDVLSFENQNQEVFDMRPEYMESSVFPFTPIPEQQLRKAENLLKKQSGVERISLREQRQNQKVIISAMGNQMTINLLKQLVRKDPATLREFFRPLSNSVTTCDLETDFYFDF